jgi:hypothetical protein
MSQYKYLGNAVSFCPYAVGSADETHKPTTGYTEIGKCTSVSVERQTNAKDIMVPGPGIARRADKIVTSSMTTIRAHFVDVGVVFWQLLWNSAVLNTGASVTYSPEAGNPNIKGWLKIQQYDQADALYNTVEVLVLINIDGSVQFGDSPVEWDMTADVINASTHDAGTLVNLA